MTKKIPYRPAYRPNRPKTLPSIWRNMPQIARGVAEAVDTGRRIYDSYTKSTQATPKMYGQAMYRGKSWRYGRAVYRRNRNGRMVMRRKYRQRVNRLFKGATVVEQATDTATATQAVHFNVNNAPLLVTARSCIYALTRMIFKKAGHDFPEPNQEVGIVFDNHNLIVVYRSTPNSGGANINIGMSTTTTINTVAQALYLALDNMVYSPGLVFDTIEITGDKTTAKMYIRDLKFDILSKVSVKMQNRSTNNPTDTFTDELDRCPISGQVLSGSGNAPLQNVSTMDLIGLGLVPVEVVQNSASGSDASIKPSPYDFRGVKYEKKLNIQPGDIKTEIIQSKYKIKLSSLVKVWILYRKGSGGGVGPFPNEAYCPWGRFKLISFEKMIGNSSVGDTGSIVVRWETELKQWIGVENKERNYMKPLILASK
nr:putative capsid protein [Cressdnaviricota sp.]